MRKEWKGIAAVAIGAVMLGGGVVGASAFNGTAPMKSGHLASVMRFVEDRGQVAPGTLDDGRDLLPQAKVGLDAAIATAKTAGTGEIGEVDLEQFNGRLAFNVDVGDSDVKVDAADGSVLASGTKD